MRRHILPTTFCRWVWQANVTTLRATRPIRECGYHSDSRYFAKRREGWAAKRRSHTRLTLGRFGKRMSFGLSCPGASIQMASWEYENISYRHTDQVKR